MLPENKIDPIPAAASTPAQPARRRLLLGLATVAAAAEVGGLAQRAAQAAPAPAATAARPAESAEAPAGFMSLSRTLTARADLSAQIGARIYQALVASRPAVATDMPRLIGLQTPGQSAEALLAAAREQGLDDLLHELVAAWYTGTVGEGDRGVLIAYAEALMYRTVSDGLIVPTYGSYGPLWWTGQPPALGVAVDGNDKKVQA